MRKAEARKWQSRSLGDRPGLHGDELVLWSAERQAGDDRAYSSRCGSRRHVLRYCRGVRPIHNEELVGEALAPFRGKVVIATKFGLQANPEDGKVGVR